MSRIINTWRDPYGEGFTPTRPRKIEIQPGLTVLVGCNGAGKTTLLDNIEEQLKEEKIPHFLYNNLNDGGSNSVSNAVWGDDIPLAAFLTTASEGEAVKENFAGLIANMRTFIQTGRLRRNPIDELFDDGKDAATNKERWLLLDAIDSGMSVDNIVEFVNVFNMIIKDAKNAGKEMYIIISANEYELCRNNPCFDVNGGKYRTFADYEDYRKFILKSREKKDARYRKKK